MKAKPAPRHQRTNFNTEVLTGTVIFSGENNPINGRMNRIDKWSSWIIDYCQYCFEKGFLANISKRSVTFSKRNAGHANREPLGILSKGSRRFQSPIASIRLNHIKLI